MDLIDLLHRYKKNKCSPEEVKQLIGHIKSGKDREIIESYLGEQLTVDGSMPVEGEEQMIKDAFDHIQGHIAKNKIIVVKWPWFTKVAALIVFGCFSILAYNQLTKHRKTKVSHSNHETKIPMITESHIKLAKNQIIYLRDIQANKVFRGPGYEFSKVSSGQFIYKAVGDINYQNSIYIGQGDNYELQLQDGTLVRLNAQSQLEFPSKFESKSRDVRLSGEAFFKVSKNKKKPFQVISNNMTVKVLGTIFNVKSGSPTQPATTTLVEGSVEVLGSRNKVLLRPGQQAKATVNGDVVATPADMKSALAWYDNVFRFSDNNLDTILKEICLWYNLELKYADGKVPTTKIGGEISRSNTAEETIKILKYSGLKVTLSQNLLIVNY